MFYPTGKKLKGRILIGIDDEEEELDELLDSCKESKEYVPKINTWLNEKGYCVESWQLRKYLSNKGMEGERIDEDMEGGFASLDSVGGMGDVTPPSSAGATNTGFYDASNNGSGDRFGSLTVGTKAAKNKQAKRIDNYLTFIKKKKKNKK